MSSEGDSTAGWSEAHDAHDTVLLGNVEHHDEVRDECDAKPADARFADGQRVGAKAGVERFDARYQSLAVFGLESDVGLGQLVEERVGPN